MDGNIFEQVKKTDPRLFIFVVIAFLALIGPAMIEIYIIDPETFKTLSLSKLILLAIGATLPVAVLNTFLCFSATKNDKQSEILPGTPDLNATVGFFVTAGVFYFDICMQYLFSYSFRTFVVIGLVLEFFVIVWTVLQIIYAKKPIKA